MPVAPRDGALALTLSDEPVFVLFKGADPREIAARAQQARFAGMPPAQVVTLLAFDTSNRAPGLLEDARYEREVSLGFGLTGWVFSRAENTLLVFAGEGAANTSRLVCVSGSATRVFDGLGREVPVKDGCVEIANRAAYIAAGEGAETSIGSPGSAAGANLLQNPSFEQGCLPPATAPWRRCAWSLAAGPPSENSSGWPRACMPSRLRTEKLRHIRLWSRMPPGARHT